MFIQALGRRVSHLLPLEDIDHHQEHHHERQKLDHKIRFKRRRTQHMLRLQKRNTARTLAVPEKDTGVELPSRQRCFSESVAAEKRKEERNNSIV